jgi:hypothetical protein
VLIWSASQFSQKRFNPKNLLFNIPTHLLSSIQTTGVESIRHPLLILPKCDDILFVPQKRKLPEIHASNSHHARKSKARRASARQNRKTHNVSVSKLSERSSASRNSALHVIAALRHDAKLSLTHASKLAGVRPETVKKYFPSALKKTNGNFQVTKSDRYTVTLYVPDANGHEIPVKTRSSREREQLGQYLGDLGRHLRGKRGALSKWQGKTIAGVELVTDPRTLIAIEPALSGFSLYRSFNAGSA